MALLSSLDIYYTARTDSIENSILRAFSWKQKPAQTAQSNRDFSSREPVRPDAEVVANGRQSTELGEDQVEEELGLGDWESDEDAVPSRGMQR